MKQKYAIIGCGRSGKAFARHLSSAGYVPSGFASRRLASARQAADLAGYQGGQVSERPEAVIGDADIILISTPDGAIGQTASEMADRGGMKPGATVFHLSGALSSTELSSLKKAGVQTGSIHPLQSFGSGDAGKNPFDGIMMGIEGDREAVETGWRMAADLGAVPFEIDTTGKMLYHASAVAASNYLVTLMKFAMDLLGESGVAEDRRFAVLKPLIMGTLGNIERTGPVDALTGPIVRGDTAIVRAHLEVIGRDAPQMLSLYKTLGKYTVDIAAEGGGISGEKKHELLSVLSDA